MLGCQTINKAMDVGERNKELLGSIDILPPETKITLQKNIEQEGNILGQ